MTGHISLALIYVVIFYFMLYIIFKRTREALADFVFHQV